MIFFSLKCKSMASRLQKIENREKIENNRETENREYYCALWEQKDQNLY